MPWVAVFATSFQQAQLDVWVGGKTIGEYATCRSRANNHVVELTGNLHRKVLIALLDWL